MNDKTGEMKFAPHGYGNNRQSVTYEKVKEYIVLYVQKTFENGLEIAKSLDELKVPDADLSKPQLAASTKTDKDELELEKKGE